MANYISNSKFEKWLERCGIAVGTFALILTVVMLPGCTYETVTPKDYASINSPPSRFKVVSSDYYHMQGDTPNITLTVFSDTQGTNDIIVVNSPHGMALTCIPKPVKQLEENK